MRIICILILLLPSLGTSDSAFARRYPDSGIFFSAIAVKDGRVVAANRRTSERNRFEVLIMKVRPTSGIIMWKRIYGSGADMIGWQLLSTSDGGFALFGKRKLTDLSRWDVLLLKLNSRGELQWSKTYFNYFGDQKGQIVQIKDDGFLMTGVFADSNFILQRVDRAGNLIWSRAFEELFAYPFRLFAIGRGQFVSAIEESGKVILLKFDSGGRILLKKQFRSVGGVSLTGAFLMPDNGFLLSGRFSLPDGRDNMFLTRLDENWKIVWSKSFVGEIQKPFGPLLGRLEVYDVKPIDDGSIAIACQIFFPLKVSQTLLFRISLSGKVLDTVWFAAENNSTPNLILPLDEGEILIAGPSFDTRSFGNPAGFLLKLDSEGKLPGCNSFQNLTVKKLDVPPVQSIEDVKLYPISVPPYDILTPELQVNVPFISGKTICK
jgi:hypothetical protein